MSDEASPYVFVNFLGWWLSCNSSSLAIIVRVLLPHSDGWTNDHYVLGLKEIGQKGLEKSHVNVIEL